jgi:hypothetical protein
MSENSGVTSFLAGEGRSTKKTRPPSQEPGLSSVKEINAKMR